MASIDIQPSIRDRVVVVRGAVPASKADWLAEVESAAPAWRGRGARALLMDLRERGFTPSAGFANALTSALGERCPGGDLPLAILTNPGVQYGGALMMCALGELRGCRAAAFHDEAEAWEWLRKRLCEDARDADAAPKVEADIQ